MRNYFLGLAGSALVVFALAASAWKGAEPAVNKNKAVVSTNLNSKDSLYRQRLNDVYTVAHLSEAGLPYAVFEKAATGYYNLKSSGKLAQKAILTIADFDQLSTRKRLYIVDLDKKELLLNTWVAHGQKSGHDEANYFSNTNSSYASSLGFYVTGEVYYGKHGRSLKLDGMDNGFNDHARSRAIVVHGADYVSQGTINALGRLGRSQGCPAVSTAVANEVINTIGGKTVLFINRSVNNYSSRFLDSGIAADFFAAI